MHWFYYGLQVGMHLPTADGWKAVEKPSSDESPEDLIARMNAKHGEGNWETRWILGCSFLGYDDAVKFFEFAYLYDNYGRPEAWQEVAADVAPFETNDCLESPTSEFPAFPLSGLVDRITRMRGLSFTGNSDWRQSQAMQDLRPEYVRFGCPELILWGDNGYATSCREFYTNNRFIVVKDSTKRD